MSLLLATVFSKRKDSLRQKAPHESRADDQTASIHFHLDMQEKPKSQLSPKLGAYEGKLTVSGQQGTTIHRAEVILKVLKLYSIAACFLSQKELAML